MNNLILEKIDEIIIIIKESKEYQDYQFLFHRLLKNERVNSLVKEVKQIQKQIVKKEVLNESINDLENQLNYLLQQLNQIPLYVDFIEKQDYLNKMYQRIKLELDTYFGQLLN